jgi:hypothetical protein
VSDESESEQVVETDVRPKPGSVILIEVLATLN